MDSRDADIVAALDRLAARVEALESEVRDVRALAARVHERQDAWPERLRSIRATPGYEDAFHGDPLVSVRIGTYQGAESLMQHALATVRRQTYRHWEAVIVGDCTTDDTGGRVAALRDDRIRYWNRAYNGPYPEDRARRWLVAGTYPFNEAAAAARGAWIAPIDDDDEWDDDHLEVLLRTAQRERAELAYGRMRAVVDGAGVETWFGAWPPRQGDFGFQAALYHAHLKEFRYDIAAQWVGEPGDWNLARRMWEAGVRFAFVDRTVGTYHVDSDAPAAQSWMQRARQHGPWQPAS